MKRAKLIKLLMLFIFNNSLYFVTMYDKIDNLFFTL